MRRSLLVTAAGLGALVCVIGGTGLFAALQDSARSGTNSVESAAMAASADIQVATATRPESGGPVTCGTFSEDLATPFFTAGPPVEAARPGTSTQVAWYCIKNVGSQQVTLSALTDELTDVETGCTGDEALHGDTTCGPTTTPGELSSVLTVFYDQFDCASGIGSSGPSALLSENAVSPSPLGTIAPGTTRCFNTKVVYLNTTASVAVQKAQSDRVTWRYRWVAQS